MQIDEYLGRARAFDGSDLHLTKELPPIMRQNGSLRPLPTRRPRGGRRSRR